MQSARFTLSWALLPAVLLSLVSAMPIESDEMVTMDYFKKIGPPDANLENPGAGNLITEEEDMMPSATKDFQSFAQMNMTGVMIEQTKEVMSLEYRCGVIDQVENSTHARRRRNTFSERKWKVKALTYRIHFYPINVMTIMTRAEVDSEIARAFEIWSNYTDLTFTALTSGQADINIDFVEGIRHKCAHPFTAERSGVLAHVINWQDTNRNIHFNDAKTWTLKSYSGRNLFQVAAHEIGHALGLHHSDNDTSVMYRYHPGYNPSFSLNAVDIEAIQGIYGKRTIENQPNETETPNTLDESSTEPEIPVTDSGLTQI